MGFLVDSSVFIDYMANRFSKNQLKSLDLIFDEAITVSAITKIEVLGFSGDPNEEIKMLEFFNYAEIVSA